MAYDPLNPKNDEDAAAQSAYAPLLSTPAAGGAPAPAAPGGAPAPTANAPAVKAPAHPGFVNFDRIMNANKSVVDRMRGDFATKERNQANALTSGFQAAEKDLTGRAKSGTVAAAPSVAPGDTFVFGDNPFGGSVSVADAQKNAAASYAGPTQADVQSRYAPLLSSYKAYQEAQGAPTGLEGRLMGKMDTSGRKGVEDAYNASFGKANAAVADAATASGQNKSKWNDLLGVKGTQDTNTGIANHDAEVTRQNNLATAQEFGNAIPEMFKKTGWGGDVAHNWKKGAALLTPDDQRELNRIAATGDHPRFIMEYIKRFEAAGGNPLFLNAATDIVKNQPMRKP